MYICFGAEAVGMVRGNTLYYVHNDQVSRPEVVTDSNRNIVWRANNAAFDRTVTENSFGGLNIGFPGQYFDQESGLYYNWHRYYDPSIGRYISSDPIGLMAGPNTYSYVLNNPIGLIDPYGLWDWGSTLRGGIKGALIGGITTGTAGAYVGGTVGTATFPIIGTGVGALGGGAAGYVFGFTTGFAIGVLEDALDQLSEPKEDATPQACPAN